MSNMKKGDDPADHTVEEVNAYLAKKSVDDDEKMRVLEAEEKGKNRKTIMENDDAGDNADEQTPSTSDDTETTVASAEGVDPVAQATPAVYEDGVQVAPNPMDPANPEGAAEQPSEAQGDGFWRTDEYGNPLGDVRPARPFAAGQTFYSFKYTDSQNPAEIVAMEDVYAVIKYPQSERYGASLAYPQGSRVPRVVLDNITDDDTGRNGPTKVNADEAALDATMKDRAADADATEDRREE